MGRGGGQSCKSDLVAARRHTPARADLVAARRHAPARVDLVAAWRHETRFAAIVGAPEDIRSGGAHKGALLYRRAAPDTAVRRPRKRIRHRSGGGGHGSAGSGVCSSYHGKMENELDWPCSHGRGVTPA